MLFDDLSFFVYFVWKVMPFYVCEIICVCLVVICVCLVGFLVGDYACF